MGAVASDISASRAAILQALLDGQQDPASSPSWPEGGCAGSPPIAGSTAGHFTEHHRFM